MTYLTETPNQYNSKRPNIKIDLPRFTADLAKALGAKAATINGNERIRIGDDVLNVSANEYKKRITVSIDAFDMKWGDWNAHDKAQHAERASVNPNGRRIELIARDIKRRVIEANQPALAARRAYAKQQQQNRDDIVKHAAALPKKYLDVRVDESAQNARIYNNAAGHPIDATLHHDNTVYVNRIGSVSAEQFIAIVKILNPTRSETK